MKWHRLLTGLLLLNFFLLNAQEFTTLPKLYPSHTQNFDDYPSFPGICFKAAFVDNNGKLWLYPCSSPNQLNNLRLFQFDGYEFRLISEGFDSLVGKPQIEAFYKGHTLIGYGRVSEDAQQQVFTYDLQKDQFRFRPFEQKGWIDAIRVTKDNRIILFMKHEGQWFFYEWIDDHLQLISQLKAPFPQRDRKAVPVLWFDEHDLWAFRLRGSTIFRVNIKEGTFKSYSGNDFPDMPNLETLLEKGLKQEHLLNLKHQDLFFPMPAPQFNGRKLLKFDSVSDRFVLVEDIPSTWGSEAVFKDEAGNLVFLFQDEKQDFKAILQDKDGNRFNYSPFFQSLSGNRITFLQSKDFRQQLLICHRKGLQLHTVKTTAAIQHFFPGKPIRSMIELPNKQFIISLEGWGLHLLNPQTKTSQKWAMSACDFNHYYGVKKFVLDDNGHIWTSFDNVLGRYDPISNTCQKYTIDIPQIPIFTLIDKNRVALTDNNLNLYIFNLITKQNNPYLENGLPVKLAGSINEMLFGQSGFLWIATNRGLWKIDVDQQKSEKVDLNAPFQDNRFLCMEEDEKGRLWLGTTLKGLHIYNPETNEVKVVNNRQGLANNTVVSITADKEGFRWLGTYNGISIVNSDGDLITNLYERDGLINRENNRFAHYRGSNGQLLIGTVKGLNLIDPQKIKEDFTPKEDLKIYLTELTKPDQNGGNKTQNSGLNDLPEIILPASRRFLSLSFALSNYFNPKENQFAYMLEGLDKDWTVLGPQHTLNLSNLPAGKYRLLIKGSDSKGNWTVSPLAIPIFAREFFYKQLWFYLLIITLLSSLALVWIRRLRFEVKRATFKIKKDKELIEGQAERLKAQAEKLQEMDEIKSRFFTNISHELRTPLTVIGGMANQIKVAPKKWLDRGINLIIRNNNNLLNLVNQILDLRKLESGNLRLELIQGDIVQYLQDIADSFQAVANSKGLKLHFLPEEPSLIMDYDKEKLLRIVSNLLSNAIKFTPEGGNIYIRLNNNNTLGVLKTPRVLLLLFNLKIQDTGIGIPADKIPHVFDRFYQVDESTTRKGEGTGIGLALSRELVRLMGGDITVQSEEGVGSTFSVQLPITQTAAKEGELTAPVIPTQTESSVNQEKPASASTSKLPTLLIIEDNPDLVQYLESFLEEQYQLLIANDGEKGIEKALEAIPDIIVSDVMMPKKDGLEVCANLKTNQLTSHIPIVLLTAKSDVESRIAGLKRGADAYMAKPFNQQELLVRLKNLFDLRVHLQQRYRSLEPLTPSQDVNIQQEDTFILKLKEVIETHMENEDFGVPQLCQIIGMSRFQLHRKIKALVGQPISQFIKTIRLQKAKDLLQTTDLNISQVAYEVGFRDPSYFSRNFIDVYGIKPSEFRNQD